MIKLKNILNEAPQKVGNVNAFGASQVFGKGKKVLGFVPDTPNAVATLIQDYPQAMEIKFKQGFVYKGENHKTIKKSDKVWKELEKRYLDTATKNAMKAGFSMNEAKVKTPTEIVTSVSASSIPGQYIPKADVMLGLHMGGKLGRGMTLTNRDYSLDYSNGKVVLKLTSSGKMAVRVRTEKIPDYVDQIKKVADAFLTDYAKDIKK